MLRNRLRKRINWAVSFFLLVFFFSSIFFFSLFDAGWFWCLHPFAEQGCLGGFPTFFLPTISHIVYHLYLLPYIYMYVGFVR